MYESSSIRDKSAHFSSVHSHEVPDIRSWHISATPSNNNYIKIEFIHPRVSACFSMSGGGCLSRTNTCLTLRERIASCVCVCVLMCGMRGVGLLMQMGGVITNGYCLYSALQWIFNKRF